MIKRFVRFLVIGICLSFLITPKQAQALTASEAVLTVAGGALAGTILGASTLPFYNTPGDHTKNIFAGAAIGAVTGVLIAAAAGFAQTNESLQDEAGAMRFTPTRATLPERSVALVDSAHASDIPLWSSQITLSRF